MQDEAFHKSPQAGVASAGPHAAVSAATVLTLCALSAGVGSAKALGPVLAVIAGAGLVWTALTITAPRRQVPSLAIPASVLAGSLSTYLHGREYWAVALILAAVGALIAFSTLRRPPFSAWALVFHAVASVSILFAAMPDTAIDVWFLHREAGEVTLRGDNPWTDLAVPNSAHTTDSEFITGYPYPPLVLATYGVVGSWLGEPRLISAASWVATISLLAAVGRRHQAALRLAWILAVQPAWALMLWTGWTEPLSIGLATGAWAAWHRFPRIRVALLGLLLASKQYLATLAALLVRARALNRQQKTATLLISAVAVGMAVVWGWLAAFDALVGFHARQPPRPDGLTLYGLVASLGGELPIASGVAPLAAVVVAWWLGRTAVDRGTTFAVGAVTLSVFHLLGSQAFANYWFVCLAFIILAMAAAEIDAVPAEYASQKVTLQGLAEAMSGRGLGPA